MTLIVGYIFIVARWGHRITLKDSNKRYEEGRKAERDRLRKKRWQNKSPQDKK